MCLVKSGQLNSSYASDGKEFIKDKHNERHLITQNSDLLAYGDPREAREALARGRHPAPPSFPCAPTGHGAAVD